MLRGSLTLRAGSSSHKPLAKALRAESLQRWALRATSHQRWVLRTKSGCKVPCQHKSTRVYAWRCAPKDCEHVSMSLRVSMLGAYAPKDGDIAIYICHKGRWPQRASRPRQSNLHARGNLPSATRLLSGGIAGSHPATTLF